MAAFSVEDFRVPLLFSSVGHQNHCNAVYRQIKQLRLIKDNNDTCLSCMCVWLRACVKNLHIYLHIHAHTVYILLLNIMFRKNIINLHFYSLSNVPLQCLSRCFL